MGAVAMKERSTGLSDRGYPVVEATLYIYCDGCGSFNIKTYVPLIKVLIIALILTLGTLLVLNATEWLMCFIPVAYMAAFLPWRDILLEYKCRKCGNVRITDCNSLHYPSYDLSVVDVPEGLIQKRYADTDVVHFHQFK